MTTDAPKRMTGAERRRARVLRARLERIRQQQKMVLDEIGAFATEVSDARPPMAYGLVAELSTELDISRNHVHRLIREHRMSHPEGSTG